MAFAPSNPVRPRRTGVWDELATPIHWFRSLDTAAKVAIFILAVVAIWVTAILSLGVAALVWPMKIIVPGMVALLVLMTWGQI